MREDTALTIQEAASLIGVSTTAIRRAITRGTLWSFDVRHSVDVKHVLKTDVLAYATRTGGKPGRPKKS